MLQNSITGPGEVVQQLRAFAVHTEEQDLVPSTHTGLLTAAYILVPFLSSVDTVLT